MSALDAGLLAARASLSDVVAIPVTPFRDGVLALDVYAALLERLLDAGVRVLTPNGNTSEFYALRPEERRELLAVTGELARGRAAVLAGVGLDVATAVADARLAAEHGATMAMIHQPVHPYVSRAGWIDYHAEIAAAVPDLGIVLYVKSTTVDGGMIRELGERACSVIGVKYAVPDPVHFAKVRREAGAERFTWIAGLAEPYALSYAAHGATGFTSGLVTVNPHLSLDLRDALRRGDLEAARTMVDSIAAFEELRAANTNADNVSVIKEALEQLGLASAEVRAPSSPLTPAGREAVSGILAEWALERSLLAPGARALATT
ncbi:dihydrodipicolinate synthase family protein [Rathayibacter caricis]|uniref:dihydrodipicolinate synthase family protein n=1 Tax=Rathayibacter caricis TaxID=110936 RepID=UPI001FB52F81|nr:dihydrodipicolinate synthase family protein [Rathayibacter caricis]MCJ1695755.1 dihydrodipicolinate synthase family protein [Rathayibacter caricis]